MADDAGSLYYTVDARTEGLLRAEREVSSSTRKMESSLGRGENAASGLGRSFDGAGSSGLKLTKMVTAISAALSVRQILDYSDAWTQTQNQLRQVTGTQQELNDVNRELLQISNRSAVALDKTAELYAKVARATRGAGVEQRELSSFVDLTNKSLRANGASAAGASALILQLSQSFNAGYIQGEEFNSILDQAPLLLEALQSATGKSTIELKKMGSEGKLAVTDLLRAVNGYADTINRKAATATNSFSDSTTIARNNMISFIGSNESAQGVIGNLGNGLVYVSNNLEQVAQGATAVAAVIAGRYARSLGIAATSHIAVAVAAVRQATANKQAAVASNQAAQAEINKALASRNAAASTLAEVSADRAALAATLSSNQAKGVQASITRQVAEMDAVSVAAKERLAAAERNVAAATATSTVVQRSNADAIARSSIVARSATVAMGGLRTVMGFLGGPAGVVLLAAYALYEFRDSLFASSRAAAEAKGRYSGLTAELYKLSDAQLAVKESEVRASLVTQQLEASKLAREIKSARQEQEALVERRNRATVGQGLGGAAGYFTAKATPVNEAGESISDLENRATEANAAVNELKEKLHDVASERIDRGRRAQEFTPPTAPADTKDSDRAAKKLKTEFDKVKQELETQRETIEREYTERNETIRKATATGSDQQEDLLRRSAERRKRDLQELSDQLVGITANQIERINQQYNEQNREILRLTEKGSAEQIEAITRNEANRQKAIDDYRAQELGSLRSHTEQVNAEYRKQQGAILRATEEGSQERFRLQQKAASDYTVSYREAQAKELQDTLNHQQAMKDAELAYQAARIQQMTGFTAEASAKLAEFQQNSADPARFISESFQNAFTNLDETISQTFTNGIRQGESFGEIMANVGRSIVADLLQSLVKLGVQMAINAAIGQSAQAGAVAGAAAAGSAMAASYAPAAALASLASFGANAAPAMAALASTTTLASGLALAGGRQYGGNVNAGSMYRVTEDGKPEIYSDGSRSYLLPGRNGKVTANKDMGGAGGGVPGVTVQLFGSGAENARVSQSEGINREQIISIMLEDSYENGPYRQSLGV